MSTINVTNLSGRGGATPNLPDGANITGVATATTFDGNLKSTGTPTLGLGVTINASGVNVSGVLTATTLYGDGSNLSGVGVTLAPFYYNPTVGETAAKYNTGIGITFNQKIIAGSGNVTLRIAGAAGTVVENFGVGSSVTISDTEISFTPAADLNLLETYYVGIPAGAFKNNTGDKDIEATNWTFKVEDSAKLLFVTGGYSNSGFLGLNAETFRSSPTQVPGVTWKLATGDIIENGTSAAIKTDGTLWQWGSNQYGQLAQNDTTQRSSPIQVGSDTTWTSVAGGQNSFLASKSDGTLWSWGDNEYGQLGLNQTETAQYSSPVQIPGTDWNTDDGLFTLHGGGTCFMIIKTNGTLWGWGRNPYGNLGQNTISYYSSPVQVPGTSWRSIATHDWATVGTKTDGTLWTWGVNTYGVLGDNSVAHKSSPVQVPGTDWTKNADTAKKTMGAVRTNGTLYTWGDANGGKLGDGTQTEKSSPIQIPGTTWNKFSIGAYDGAVAAIKTDGTLWTWGYNEHGVLGLDNTTSYSSPKQVGSETYWTSFSGTAKGYFFQATDTTP